MNDQHSVGHQTNPFAAAATVINGPARANELCAFDLADCDRVEFEIDLQEHESIAAGNEIDFGAWPPRVQRLIERERDLWRERHKDAKLVGHGQFCRSHPRRYGKGEAVACVYAIWFKAPGTPSPQITATLGEAKG